jgi:uncharacterized protein (TIGR00251 family)
VAEIQKWATKNVDGVIVRLYVQPNASLCEVSGEHGTGDAIRLKIRIAAPPVDSAANQELVYFLKKSIGIPASRIHLVRGAASRSKDVLLERISLEEAIEKLRPRRSQRRKNDSLR